MQHKVALAVTLKLSTETRSRVMHLVLPFSSLMRGCDIATVANADAHFARNLWREVEANIIVEDDFNQLNSIGLLEAYAGKMAGAYDAAVSSGETCVFKFSELRYTITTAISGTKFKAIGRNLYNSVASVVSAEFKDKGTRCNRITIEGESMPVLQFSLNANLEGTAHGEHICSNKSSSAADIAKFVDNMQHARPSFDHGMIQDAPTGGVTIAKHDDMSQVEKISFIRGVSGGADDNASVVSSLSQGLSVHGTKNTIRMTEILGPYTTNKRFATRPSASKRAPSKSHSPLPSFFSGNVKNTPVLDVPPSNPLKRFTLLRRNIPNVDNVLTSDFINAGHQVNGMEFLFTQKDEIPADRWAELLSIASRKIEASHKRNTVKVEQPISNECFLEWCAQFSRREAEKGIYVPPFQVLSTHNVMGVEWLTGSVPDSLYERFPAMKTALQVDLEFYLSKNPVQLQIVRKHQCGYRAFHTLILSLYTSLYLHKTPDFKLLHFDIRSMSLASFIDTIIEFFHQQSVCGVDMDHYREFRMFINQLPPKYQHHLKTAMSTLMNSSQFYDSCNRVPPGCKRDGWLLFCTQTFTSVGIRFDSAVATSGSPRIRSISADTDAPTSRSQLLINAVQGKPFQGKPFQGKPFQGKPFICYLCKGPHKFLRCPNLEVRLKNEQFRSQFDKVFPPSSSRIAAIATASEDLPTPPTDHDAQQESEPILATSNDDFDDNVFDDDVIDNSHGLFAIGSELYRDDPCTNDDGDEMLQMYPVTRCPVCAHCKSVEHPSHLCPVVSVNIDNRFDEVSCEDDELFIHAVDNLSSGEDDDTSLDNIALAGEDTITIDISTSSAPVLSVLQDSSVDRTLAMPFGSDFSNSRYRDIVFVSAAQAHTEEIAVLDNLSLHRDLPDADGAGFGIYALDEDEDEVQSTSSTSSSSLSA